MRKVLKMTKTASTATCHLIFTSEDYLPVITLYSCLLLIM